MPAADLGTSGHRLEFVEDLIEPFVIGRTPFEVGAIWEDLYDLQRVRGYTGGFWLDAMASVDIALWDLFGKLVGQPLHNLLGGRHRDHIPAYRADGGLPLERYARRSDRAGREAEPL